MITRRTMKKKLTPAEYSKQWRKDNPERVKDYAKKYVETHKEEISERNRIIRDELYFGGRHFIQKIKELKKEDIVPCGSGHCEVCKLWLEKIDKIFGKELCSEEKELTPTEKLDKLKEMGKLK